MSANPQENELRVDIRTEFNRIGWELIPTNDPNWLATKCPFHADTTPSCYVNLPEQYFTCKACPSSGNIPKFLARVLNQPTELVFLELLKRYKQTAADKPVENNLVEKYHAEIWRQPALLQELYKRGFTDEAIRYYRWGADSKGAIRIPIKNANGVWVDIITYRPGAPEKKFTHMTGRGKPRIYPIEQLQYNSLLLCGGLAKAIVAAMELNQYGIGCVSSTGGEQFKNWPRGFIEKPLEFLGICLDIDKTGRSASRLLANAYYTKAKLTKVITLPLDPDKYPKGDISDFIGLEKQQLLPVLQAAEAFEPDDLVETPTGEPERTTLRTACHAASANKRVLVRALVSSKEIDAFFLPKRVSVVCDKQQDFCGRCPIYRISDDPAFAPELNIHPECSSLLEMVNAPVKQQHDLIRKSLSIPPCKAVQFTPLEQFHVNQIRLTNDLDSGTGWEDESAVLDAVAVDVHLELNETYDLTGRIVPHPNTQRATALISQSSTVVDSLSEYTVQPELMEKFTPKDWTVTSITHKLTELYNDLEEHVTHIWERKDLHVLYDLAFHSVLYFKEGKNSQKGVVEVLVVGDSANGKTQVIERMIRYYGLGQKTNMENATIAGLLGGVNEANKRRFISWGILPANHGRFVFLDELKDAPAEVMSKLTDLRSSGRAEIPKIERGSARARVRLAASSNGRSDLPAMAYSYGLDIIREVIPNPEDIRRFDACMVISSDDVSPETLQRAVTDDMNEGYFTAASCRALVLWGWTRKPEQVVFENWPHILECATKLLTKYVDTVPILDKGGTRYKIARLAAALAVRTFSHADGDYETVYVRQCHVEYIFLFLNALYTAKAFGYDRFSDAVIKQNQIEEPNLIVEQLSRLPYPQLFAERLLQTNNIELRDICDWTGFDRLEGAAIISLLVRTNAIKRDGPSRYRKSASFMDMLKNLVAGNTFSDLKPEYLQGQL